MPEVIALTNFDHDHGRYRMGDRVTVSDRAAAQLIRKGMATEAAKAPAVLNPQQPSGAKSSASPVGQASPQTIAILSVAGAALAKSKPKKARKTAQ